MKRTVESLTPPENKQVMWLDVSGKVKQLKTYINGEWVIVNDDTENNEEIVKEILGKIDKDFESYIKKEDADSKYVQQEVLDRDYVKSEYATKTYATIKELNNLSTSLDSDYVKKTYADSNYVIKDTLDGYITKSYADNTYATKSTLENYVTITDADTKYVSTGTLDNYVTIETANSTYATQTALAGKVAQETYDAKMTAIDSKLKTLENKTIDVDAELKDSPNPVQNRAVNAAVLNLNTEIGKKANSTDLNSAVGRITALENNGATGVTVTESGEGNGIASIKNVGKNIIATKATFVTSLTGYVTTDTLNTELAKKSDVGHTHTQYAETSALDNYALKSALDNYVTTSSLNQKNFATQTWVNNQGFAIGTIPTKVSQLTNDSGFLTNTALNGYVNEVQPDGTQSGNGIANITKEGKVLKVTKATFLTEHQSLADYATQAWVRQNAATQEWVKSQNYLTANDLQETIKITLVSTKSTSDAALRGAKITVKNGSSTIGTYTWQGSVISLKVASGLEVTVSVSDVTGYKTPAEQKFMTAMSNIREVKMEYKEQKLGVYILETDGTMTDPTNWTKSDNSTILGIYVGGENCAFVMALEGESLPWAAQFTTVVPGVKSEDGSEAPTTDYDGIGNTKKFIAASPNNTERTSAAYYCNNYQFKNGKNGYLLALGEALVVHKNSTKITQAYNAIRCSDTAVSLQEGYWTSNQSSRYHAWYSTTAVQDAGTASRAESYFVIPVCQY